MSSKVAIPFTFPTAMKECSCCSTSLTAFGVVSVLDFVASNKNIVVSHCFSSFHFPGDIWSGASFHMIICHLYIFSHEISVKVFGPFSNHIWGRGSYTWVLRVLCTFWITDFYQMCLLQIFSSSLWIVFQFSWCCLLQNFIFILIKSRLLFFFSWICLWYCI